MITKRLFCYVALLLGQAVAVNAGDGLYGKFPGMKGWEKEHNYDVYRPDNLWDYINGAAEAYLGYDFIDLHIAEYRKGKSLIKVEIYRHGTSDHAFGIYSLERSPDLSFFQVGAQGYLQGDILNFFCFDYYVKMFSNSSGKKTVQVMKAIAGLLADNLGTDPAFPAVLGSFPLQGRAEHTESFVSQNFLGHEFFSNVYTCRYHEGDDKYQLFIAPRESEDECRQLLVNYFRFTKQDEGLIRQGKLLLTDPYNGDIHLVWQGTRLFGVIDADNPSLAERYLQELQNRLE